MESYLCPSLSLPTQLEMELDKRAAARGRVAGLLGVVELRREAAAAADSLLPRRLRQHLLRRRTTL
jgi:hypothetical protein